MDDKPKSKIKTTWSYISNIISWTSFTILLICALLLVYYFFALQIYARKGSGYEPAFSLYTIVSPSMTPNIKVYDVVVDVKVKNPEDIEIGDVITFNSNNPNLVGKTITHRVIAITKDKDGNYLYQTKGDANLIEDDNPVPYNLIVGKVAMRIPQLGRVQFILASSMGWLILILIPALYVIIKDIVNLIKISKMSEEEYAEYQRNLKNKKKKNNEELLNNKDNINNDVKVAVNVSENSIIEDDQGEFDISELPTLKEETNEETKDKQEEIIEHNNSNEYQKDIVKENNKKIDEFTNPKNNNSTVKKLNNSNNKNKKKKPNYNNKNNYNKKKKTYYNNKNKNNNNKKK